jgi:hypothetical protein
MEIPMAKPKAKQALPNEPTTSPDSFRLDYANALNWYNYHWEDADYAKSALDYVKHSKMKDYVFAVTKADHSEIRAIGVLGRLAIRDQYIDLEYAEKMIIRLENLKSKYGTGPVEIKVIEKVAVQAPSIQDRMNEKALVRGGEVDEEIEKFIKNGYKSTFSMKKHLQSKQIAGPIAKKIAEFYKPELAEIEAVLAGKDDDLKEAYNLVSTPRLKAYYAFLKMIVEDCGERMVVAKTQRKPRVKKAKSPIRLTEKMVYMPDFPDLKLTSIPASKIIGASELWVYNTASRKLIVYQAIDKDGLGVSGGSITNYDVNTSETKTIRNPEKFFDKWTPGGKRAMANMWKAIRAKVSKPRARINKDMILLTVN